MTYQVIIRIRCASITIVALDDCIVTRIKCQKPAITFWMTSKEGPAQIGRFRFNEIFEFRLRKKPFSFVI